LSKSGDAACAQLDPRRKDPKQEIRVGCLEPAEDFDNRRDRIQRFGAKPVERIEYNFRLLRRGDRDVLNRGFAGQRLQTGGGLPFVTNGRHGGNRSHAGAPILSYVEDSS
jgi:hypothetical protein